MSIRLRFLGLRRAWQQANNLLLLNLLHNTFWVQCHLRAVHQPLLSEGFAHKIVLVSVLIGFSGRGLSSNKTCYTNILPKQQRSIPLNKTTSCRQWPAVPWRLCEWRRVSMKTADRERTGIDGVVMMSRCDDGWRRRCEEGRFRVQAEQC